jgi:hypothetical protein
LPTGTARERTIRARCRWDTSQRLAITLTSTRPRSNPRSHIGRTVSLIVCQSPPSSARASCWLRLTRNSPTRQAHGAVSETNSGNDLLSQRASPQVPSALAGLTSVFGMGTGVTLPLWSPETFRPSASSLSRASHRDFRAEASESLRPQQRDQASGLALPPPL